MNRHLLISTLALLGLGGEATPGVASALQPDVKDASAPRTVGTSLAVKPSQLTASDTAPARLYAHKGAPASRVAAANHAATHEPTSRGYANAAQVYAWMEGAIYRLYTAPERVSAIALQAGETLISVAAGDTVRWVIGDTTSGTGAGRRTHILVKPSATGLRTNLFVTTDRRVYHIHAESTARTAMASMSWTYPQDVLIAIARTEAAAATPAPTAGGIAVEALNFHYRIEGDAPRWRPVRVFDDGVQVFVEFPVDIDTGEVPPLFVIGASGGAELVNYRVRGRYYVVDRLFARAELRLGERKQQTVRIERIDAPRVARGRGRQS